MPTGKKTGKSKGVRRAVGRPLSFPGQHLLQWQIRITRSQRAAYERAARRAGVKLSDWARQALDRAAEA